MSSFLKVFRTASKAENILRSLLIIPYFAWGVGLAVLFLVGRFAGNSGPLNTFFEVLAGVAGFFTIGIILWGIPYTLLVIGLLLWSLHKPAPAIYKAFVFSPLLLSMLMVIEVALISFWPQQTLYPTDLTDFLSYTLLAVIPSLVIGYGFVGGGVILYRAMSRINLINIEGEAK